MDVTSIEVRWLLVIPFTVLVALWMLTLLARRAARRERAAAAAAAAQQDLVVRLPDADQPALPAAAAVAQTQPVPRPAEADSIDAADGYAARAKTSPSMRHLGRKVDLMLDRMEQFEVRIAVLTDMVRDLAAAVPQPRGDVVRVGGEYVTLQTGGREGLDDFKRRELESWVQHRANGRR